MANPLIRTVTECAICQGYPEENVLQHYVQKDPTRPAVPLTLEDPIFFYQEEEEASKGNRPWTGLMKPLFKALNWMLGAEVPPEDPEEIRKRKPRSKKIAEGKQSGGLFER